MLKKIYKNDDKFCGTGDKFKFEVTIFSDKCRQVNLLIESYIKKVFIILLGKIKTDYYANYGNTYNFDQFYLNM